MSEMNSVSDTATQGISKKIYSSLSYFYPQKKHVALVLLLGCLINLHVYLVFKNEESVCVYTLYYVLIVYVRQQMI